MLYVAVWAIPMVSATVSSPVLAHLLPPEQFGQLATGIAVHQVLLVLAVVGLDQALILARAEAGSDRPARSLIVVGLVIACGITGLAVLTAPLWSQEVGFVGSIQVVVVTTVWTLPAAGLLLASTLLLSQDRLKAFTFVVASSGVGGQAVGLGLLAGTASRDAGTYASGYLVALTVTWLVGLVLVRLRWHGLIEGALTRRALALGMPLMVGNLAAYVLNAGDRLVIQRLLGSAEAGRYQIAYIVGEAAVAVLTMTSTAWAPRVTAVRDEAARWALLARARDGLVQLMTPALLGVTLGAPLVLGIVAPASYSPQGLLGVVFLVTLAGFPVLIGSTWARALVTLRRSRAVALSAIVAAAVNVGLNFALLPAWGLAGAAVATLVAYSVQALIQRLALPRAAAWPKPPWTTVVVALAVIGTSAGTLLLPQTPAWTIWRFIAAVACLPWFFLELRALRAPGWRRRGEGRTLTGEDADACGTQHS